MSAPCTMAISRAEIEAALGILREGERPMPIRWRLEHLIPAAWLPAMALAV